MSAYQCSLQDFRSLMQLFKSLMVPEEPIKAEEVEAQTADVATGSPKSSPEEALLSRLVALEAEVLKLRGEPATSRPSPELSESPRRPAENAERSEVEAQQAMSSLGMSLLSSSSLFASVSVGEEGSPEHRDEEQQQSEDEKRLDWLVGRTQAS
eukprot:s621_g12.t1